MSRLIVKNLPKNITDKRLKQLFTEKGVVTDVQLKYTAEGKFRRFAFIGYKTEEQATEALQYFDKSCIDTCTISVEYCSALGDESKPKSWSKYAADSKINEKKKKNESILEEKQKEIKDKKKKSKKGENEEIKSLIEKYKDDPMFDEFLQSHNIDEPSKLIGCTEEQCNENSEESSEDETKSKMKKTLAVTDISDQQYMEILKNKSKSNESAVPNDTKKAHKKVFYTVKLNGLACTHKKKDIKQFFKPISTASIRVPRKIKGIAYVGFKTEKAMKQALNKNRSFLDGKRIFVSKYEKSNDNKDNNNPDDKSNVRWQQQEEALKMEESIAESGRIFLRNLSYSTTEDDIRKVFEKYGLLTEVNLPIDKITRNPKGFGTVTFLMPEHAVKAYTELDGSILDGRMLHLLPGKTKNSLEELLNDESTNYKQKKQLQQKITSASSHNWNTLFLGQNAVADAIAKTYNVTKEQVLQDAEGASVAVRLALGETQLVEETQKFLEDNGVHLEAFSQIPSKRSETVILVKNLPAGTTSKEIRELFEKFGEICRIVLPPSGISALVEFVEPSEARKAFTRLAYTKFKYLPLYLEKAPHDAFKTAPKVLLKESEKLKSDNFNLKNQQTDTKNENIDEVDEEEDDEPEPDTTLFVKNLNFSTTEEKLKEHFSKCGVLHYANISMKKDPKNPKNKLSMGYGFVRYKLKANAEQALKELQMSDLDGKALELKRSERTLPTDISIKKNSTKMSKQTGTKILVRNVPFQANANEITELFKAFGELKAVRLPKKLVGDEKHRGFAFVEYYTKKEAKRAFQSLSQSTHLYGRRLVLEWAETEESIEGIRKRTAKHFVEGGPKKNKKSTLNPELIGLEAQ